jgi:uncharacterized phage infection (PIP) family protein YhgE
MKYAAMLGVLAIFSALSGFSQTSQPNASDSQTLKEILIEIRGLHNDVRLSQTSQILLAELEVQQTAVNRAIQRRDDAKTKLAQVQTNQKNIATQLARFEENAAATSDPVQKKQLTQMQDQFTANLATLKNQEPDAANDLQQAEIALRKEQDTLQGIQGQLDDVIKRLEPLTNP